MTRSGRVVGLLANNEMARRVSTLSPISRSTAGLQSDADAHLRSPCNAEHLLSTNSCAQPCFCASARAQSGTHRNFRCRSRIRVSNRLAMFHKQSAALTSLRPGQSSAARLCPPATIDRTDREPARRFGSPCQGTNSNTYSPWQASSFKKT